MASRPALMYVFMGHMRYQDTKPFPDSLWDEERLELVVAILRGLKDATIKNAIAGGQVDARDLVQSL